MATIAIDHDEYPQRVFFHVQPWWIRKPANSSDSSEPFDIILTSVAAGLAMVQKPPGPGEESMDWTWIIQSSQLKSAMKGDLLLSKKNTSGIGSARFALPFRLSLFQVMTLDSWASGFVRQLMDIQVWTGGLLGKKRRIRSPKDDENFDMEKSSSWGLKWKASPFLTYFPLNHHDFW